MSSWRGENVLILTASSGLGSFAPAFRLRAYLRSQGAATHLYCIEQLFDEYAVHKHQQTRAHCRASFRKAMLLQKVVEQGGIDLTSIIDPDKFDTMMHIWQQEKFTRCIVFSGFWISALAVMTAGYSPTKRIDAIHMDAVPSSSWLHAKTHSQAVQASVNDIYLYQNNRNSVFTLYPVEKPLDWQSRSSRVLGHGGGWQMGDLATLNALFNREAIYSNMILPADTALVSSIYQRILITDHNYHPWENLDKLPDLTVLPEANSNEPPSNIDFEQLARSAPAIITKPGGASLLDSINLATPLVLLPAFGEYEKQNANTWLSLGFAVTFEQWQDSGYSFDVLKELHNNLLNHSAVSPIFGVSNETCD
ncbi:hypothetical protein [Pseudoalteromonas luteoviolacea]|uniref:UDP-glucuronosyltransferase n=1 Tax=Pseudoalteromonas luteoviolacea NCIMB 1942 TaxID=1365253 RepID=A0A167HSE5_9GAMM|nr:hypothetical protein [Pseudoalteromonas luteoviolacea]KZN58476.1 hypothetical protein N482_21940 [Pseudoalteromonas luteoviolacea NCIMB 1942]